MTKFYNKLIKISILALIIIKNKFIIENVKFKENYYNKNEYKRTSKSSFSD